MPQRTTSHVAPWVKDALRQGFLFLQAGEPEKASDCCRRILGASPQLPEGHFLVGLIALELNQRRTAVEAFGSVTTLQPDHAAAWAHLARLFMQVGQPVRADAALEKAVLHEDGKAIVHDLIGNVQTLLGDDEEALCWHARAVAAEPENVGFLVNYANCQMFAGLLDEAAASLREALGMQPGNANAHWILAGLRKVENHDHIDELRKLIATGKYPPKSLAFLAYGLGKELEDLREWDEAFNAFEQGADARRKTLDFDEAKEIEMYAALERLYTSEWMAAAGEGFDSSAPVFIVGQPRTGTTLVERVITAHSQVHSAGELKQFGNALRRLTNYSQPGRFSAELVEGAAATDFHRLGEMYIETTRKMAGDAPRFVDKLPSNFLYVPLILKALPNAKIIHLRRNPMDACFSSFKQLFADAYPHSYDQAELARHHARYYRLMETWRDRFGDRFHEVAYEQVASDLEPNARVLIEFLGLPWEDACLEFHKQKAAVTTASAVQVREPAHTRSIGRWRQYEAQLEPTRRVLEKLGVPLELQ